MKAMIYTRFGPPEVFQLEEVDKPTPKENEVLIRIYATSVVKEDPDFRASPGFNGFLKPRNQVLGQELAGVVEAVGNAVTRYQPGDQVFGIDNFGAYAEYICMPEDSALATKPVMMSFVEVAGTQNGALKALPFLRDQGHIRPALARKKVTCGRHRVARLMRRAGLCARPRRKTHPITTQRAPERVPAPNLLNQNFPISAPNQKWVVI